MRFASSRSPSTRTPDVAKTAAEVTSHQVARNAILTALICLQVA